MKRLLPGIAVLFILFPLLTQCDVSHKRPGEQAQIPASAQTVTFSGATWSDVAFQHEQHSDRYKGMCIKCHDHQPIAGQTHWYCRSCHTAGQDREKLCTAIDQHGCIMTQCQNCHEVKGANPGLTCIDCHKKGAYLSPSYVIPPLTEPPGSIGQKNQVDHYTLPPIPKSGNLVIDVQAWEAHSGFGRPTDYFGDGDSNNRLLASIYLFRQDGTFVSSPIGENGGNDAPGAHDTRSCKNAYLQTSINPGTYVLAIGSYPLSQADAWAKYNNDGSSWSDHYYGPLSYNKYRINIYYQSP